MKRYLIIFLALSLTCIINAKDFKRPAFSYLFQQAIDEYYEDNNEHAMQQMKQELEANPQNGYAYFFLGKIAIEDGMNEDAILLFQKAEELISPQDREYYWQVFHYRSIAELNLEDAATALKSLNKALSLTKDEGDIAQIINQRAEVYYQISNYNASDADYYKLLKYNPFDPNPLKGLARNAIEQDKYDEAIEYLNKAIDLDNRDAYTYAFRAEAYYNKGDLYKALDDNMRSLDNSFVLKSYVLYSVLSDTIYDETCTRLSLRVKMQPENTRWLLMLANTMETHKDYEKAIAVYQQKYDIENEAIDLKYIGDCYAKNGQFVEAIAAYKQSYTQDSTIIDALSAIAYCHFIMGNEQETLEYDNMAITANPDDAEMYIYLANHCLRMGKLDEALKNYDTALSLDPQNDLAFFYRGITRAKLGFDPNADYAMALQFNDNNVLRKSMILARMGQKETSLEILEYFVAIEMSESDYYNIACAYALLNMKNKALEYLERALQDDPLMTYYYVMHDYDFENIKDDVQFLELLQRCGRVQDNL